MRAEARAGAAFILGLAILGLSALGAQAQTSPTPSYSTIVTRARGYGDSIAFDQAGNAYLDVDPYSGSPVGVAQVNASGAAQWFSIFANSNGDFFEPTAIAADAAGNTYTTVADYSNSSGLLFKVNSSGGSVGSPQTTPEAGNLDYYGPAGVAYDPKAGSVYIVESFLNVDHDAILVQEYDSNLKPEAQQIIDDGSPVSDDAKSITVDSSGNVYVAGVQNTGDFEAIKLTPHLASIVYLSSEPFGASQNPVYYVNGITVDASGNAYLAGEDSNGSALAKLDPNGNVLFANDSYANGSISFEEFLGDAVDSQGRLYGLNQGGGSQQPTSMIGFDNTSGNILWNIQVGALPALSASNPIEIDSQNNIYVAVSSEVFDPSTDFYPQAEKFMASGGGSGSGSGSGSGLLISISTGGTTASPQVGVIGSSVATPLTVLIVNQNQMPQSQTGVNFSITPPANGATLSAASANTNANGFASTVFTLGTVPTSYSVMATCPTCQAPSVVTFQECAELANADFQQGNILWASKSYDHACEYQNSANKRVEIECDDPDHPPAGTTAVMIMQDGCGLSSLATLNDYYRSINPAIPETNPLDLNNFLDESEINGYQGAGKVDWTAISSFTSNAIHYVPVNGGDIGGQNTQQSLLQTANADLLASTPRPVIFRVHHRSSSGAVTSHFVVAVGVCGSEYVIADPAGTRTLYDPNDPDFTFWGIRRFSP